MSKLEKLSTLLIQLFLGTYLHSFDEFKQKMESDNEFYNKVVKELNQNKDE